MQLNLSLSLSRSYLIDKIYKNGTGPKAQNWNCTTRLIVDHHYPPLISYDWIQGGKFYEDQEQ